MAEGSDTQPLADTAVAVLRRHALTAPNRPAADFMDGLGRLTDTFSYGDLDREARRIGGGLAARLPRGARVIVAEPPGLRFVTAFFGCLYAGMIAVPVAMPRKAESDETERFALIIRDADVGAILSTAETAARIADMPPLANLAARLWIDVTASAAPLAEPVAAIGKDIAFLQYTSGSTGSPKGVMVTHGNIVHNAHRIMTRCRLSADSRALIWLPHFHDLGLIGGILVPIYAGFPTTLMSPLSFAKRPLAWIRRIGDGGYTISGGPNFAFRLCVERLDAGALDGLDLSRWSCAFNCAEPIEAETVRAFAETFAPWGFKPEAIYPCYGMAEATLTIASHPGPRPVAVFGADADQLEESGRARPATEGARRRDLVAVGQAAADQVIAIVDPVTLSELGEGELGEIWSADASIAAGYWRKPEETEAVFGAHLPARPGLSFLRTGDLGFIAGGELYITGRLKDLIIVDGRNLHPEDIEATVRTATGTGATLAVAAFSAPSDGRGERLVVVIETERRRDAHPAALKRSAQAALTRRYEVSANEILIVPSGSVPRTTSGKVRRNDTRKLYQAGHFHNGARLSEPGSVPS